MRIVAVIGLSLLLLVDAAHAAPIVSVTACGQAVPPNAHGVLASDLDCTGFVGGISNEAVSLGSGAVLDLQGFTITGGLFGIGCYELCADGSGACHADGARCTIVNGTVTSAEASGISGNKVTVKNVTSTNNGENGAQGYRKLRVVDSVLSNNGIDGARAWSVLVEGSTVTGNARFGVGGGKISGHRYSQGIRLRRSTVTGNGTAPACGTPDLRCGDLSSGTRPKLRYVDCGTSRAPHNHAGCTSPGSWCLCTND